MQLHYELIGPKELTKTERMLLACSGEEFFFLRRNGVLLINKGLRSPKRLTKIATDLWRHEGFGTEQDTDEINDHYNRVLEIAGKEAAYQLLSTWNEAFQEKMEAGSKREASEWIQNNDILDELDAISETEGAYRPDFIKALWSQTKSTNALFLYGYQKGMEAAGKGVAIG